jgi:multiple sugar transport system permease protein
MSRRVLLSLGIGLSVGSSLLPFLWFVLTSFKSPVEVESTPPTWWPSGSWSFYRAALFDHDLLRYVANSAVVAGSTTVLALILGVPAAYALARLAVPGKRVIMALLLCISMFPQLAIAAPLWQLLDRIGGLNHHWGIVLPYVALTLPLAVWILASFFKELPAELEDAARVDGCGPWTTLVRITLPLASPGIFTAAILILIYAWNEFFFALLILTQPEQQTLPVGIALFQGEFTVPWGELAAASVVATLPLILVVLLCQRWIISGLSAGAVKG